VRTLNVEVGHFIDTRSEEKEERNGECGSVEVREKKEER